MSLTRSFTNMSAALQHTYKTVMASYAAIKDVGLKKISQDFWKENQQEWNALKKEVRVENFSEFLRLVVTEVCKRLMIGAAKTMFEFAVKYTFPRLGRWITPILFTNTPYSSVGVDYFSTLMARYCYTDCANIIISALQHAPEDLRAQMFTKSLSVQSKYYTDKLIPPAVNNSAIVSLIEHNNMPLLAQVLNASNLTFMVAAAAVLNHEKLVETFEHRVDLSQVVQFINGENWRNHGVYIRAEEKNNLSALYQNKMLRREILSVIDEQTTPIQRRKM